MSGEIIVCGLREVPFAGCVSTSTALYVVLADCSSYGSLSKLTPP